MPDNAATAIVASLDFARPKDSVGPHIAGIAGPPGSGKSTLARKVAEHADAETVVVPMDGFHLSQHQLRLQDLDDVKGSPATFDLAGLLCSLKRLMSPQTVYFPDFAHERHDPMAARIRVDQQTELVIVEGNYLLLDEPEWSQVAELLTLRVFIETPWAMCRPRLIERHRAAGKSAEAAVEWVDRSDRANYDLVMSSRLPADITIHAGDPNQRVSLSG